MPSTDCAPVPAPAPLRPAPEAERVDKARARTALLYEREDELNAALEKLAAERAALREEIKVAESELDAAVNAPVSGSRDPTEWLPDEILVAIILAVKAETMWVCDRVCLRWKRVMESAPSVAELKREVRWAGYDVGVIVPRVLEGHTGSVRALAVGVDGKIYSGSDDMWRGRRSLADPQRAHSGCCCPRRGARWQGVFEVGRLCDQHNMRLVR